jgi:hypothetical protein
MELFPHIHMTNQWFAKMGHKRFWKISLNLLEMLEIGAAAEFIPSSC